MAGECVEVIPCSECGSSRLQVWKEGDKYTGFCFGGHHYVADPYQDKPEGYIPPPAKLGKSPEEREKEKQEVSTWGCHDIPDRFLRKESLEYFDVKVGVSEIDGTTPHCRRIPRLYKPRA